MDMPYNHTMGVVPGLWCFEDHGFHDGEDKRIDPSRRGGSAVGCHEKDPSSYVLYFCLAITA
jgi:hypothetical protein